jgi:hypothetical protein
MKPTTDPWDQFEIDPEGFKQIDFSQRLVSPRPETMPHTDDSVENKPCKGR